MRRVKKPPQGARSRARRLGVTALRACLPVILLCFFPSPGLSQELLEGRYCYAPTDKGNIEEARNLVRTLALRNAVESYRGFRDPSHPGWGLSLPGGLFQVILSGCVREIKVVEHKEEGHSICERVQVRVSAEDLDRILEKEAGKEKRDREELGIANNGCLKILRVTERLRDRYGEYVEAVVKVLRRTGSLQLSSERNRKPCFKICVDYLGPDGVPVGGDSIFVHESDVEMLPGEIRVIRFNLAKDAAACKVWLPGSSEGAKRSREIPREKRGGESQSASTGRETLEIKDIQTFSSEGELRIAVQADSPVRRYRYFFLEDPPRLVVDLAGTWRSPRRSAVDVNQRLVRRIRVGHHPDRMRVVIDLEKDGPLPTVTFQETPTGLSLTLRMP